MLYYNRRNQQNDRVLEIYERKYGNCSFDEKKFVLIDSPMMQWHGHTYIGLAISPEDIITPNEGELPIYELTWETFEEWEEQKDFICMEYYSGRIPYDEYLYITRDYEKNAFDLETPVDAELTGDTIDLKTGL